MNVRSIVARNHERYVVVLDILKIFSRQWLQHRKWRSTYPRKRKLLFEIEKSIMIKTKMLLKITVLDEQEPSVQSRDRTKTVQV